MALRMTFLKQQAKKIKNNSFDLLFQNKKNNNCSIATVTQDNCQSLLFSLLNDVLDICCPDATINCVWNIKNRSK